MLFRYNRKINSTAYKKAMGLSTSEKKTHQRKYTLREKIEENKKKIIKY